MLHENWLSLLLLSFCAVSVAKALLSSCTNIFYREKSFGQMTHSQLRIKQGNATIEHRLNVFVHSLLFNCGSFRIYFITILLWTIINTAFLLSPQNL